MNNLSYFFKLAVEHLVVEFNYFSLAINYIEFI